MYINFINFLFFSLTFTPVPSQNVLCPKIVSSKYEIQWPETTTQVISNPPCFDQNREFLYRNCDNGVWSSEPDCVYIQSPNRPECPEGFNETNEICFSYSFKTVFLPRCPFEDVLPFRSYINEISNTSPIWMPVRRDLSNGIGLLQWTETSSLYKTNFNDNYFINGTIQGKDCLLYYNSSYILAVSCYEEHVRVCAYRKFSELDNSLCAGECQRSDFSSNFSCVCKGNAEDLQEYPKATFSKSYQTYKKCGFGLQNVFNGSSINIYRTRRSNNDNNQTRDILTSGGSLTEAPLTCILCEKRLSVTEPELLLTLKSNIFILEITNAEGLKTHNSRSLVYCYTNAKSVELLHRYEFSGSSYSFVLEWDGPGEYWCESFAYPNLKPIKSNLILSDGSFPGFEFIAIFAIQLNTICYSIDPDTVKLCHQILTSCFQNSKYLQTYTLRIMRIIDMHEDNNTITINVHFSSKFPSANFTEDEEFTKLKTSLEDLLKGTKRRRIELVEFRSLDFCSSDTTTKITFPRTAAGFYADLDDFCFTRQGDQVHRLCRDGGFVNGAQWSTFEDCEVVERSEVTEQLLSLIDVGNTNICGLVAELTQKYQKFKILDIYLTEKLLYCCLELDLNATLISFMEAYNNLMNIDKGVMEHAEKVMWATSSLLHTFTYSFYRTFQTSVPLLLHNFIYVKLPVLSLTGIFVQKYGKSTLSTSLHHEYTLDQILSIENLESAIFLSPNIRYGLDDTNTVSFTHFFNNALFTEDKVLGNVSRVYSAIYLQEDTASTGEEIWLVWRPQPEDQTYMCASWNYGDKMGWWKITGVPERVGTFLLCKFSAMTYDAYYSIVPFSSSRTDSLRELLACDCSVSEIVDDLRQISHESTKFTPVDVFLTGKIFEKISHNSEFDLQHVANIVSNLHDVEPKVLDESQQTMGAADLIHTHSQKLLQNYNYQMEEFAGYPNYVIFMTRLQETNFTGLALSSNGFQVLEDEDEAIKVLVSRCFDVAVIFSSELKRQLKMDDKIIITIYKNDVLFKSQFSETYAGLEVFGVTLPTTGNYSGPIFVFNRLSMVKSGQCVNWTYNMTTGVHDPWQISNEQTDELPDLIQCQIWHNSHSTLIIEDEFTKNSIFNWILLMNFALSLLGLLIVLFTTFLSNSVVFYIAVIYTIQAIFLFKTVTTNVFTLKVCSLSILSFNNFFGLVLLWVLGLSVCHYKKRILNLGEFSKKCMWKMLCWSWFMTLIPLISFSLIDYYFNMFKVYCYPLRLGIFLNVWYPVGLLCGIHTLIYTHIAVMFSPARARACTGDKTFQSRLELLLGVMLVAIWIFGSMGNLGFESCVYWFCYLVTLQGFVIFLFTCISILKTEHKSYCNAMQYEKL